MTDAIAYVDEGHVQRAEPKHHALARSGSLGHCLQGTNHSSLVNTQVAKLLQAYFAAKLSAQFRLIKSRQGSEWVNMRLKSLSEDA